MGPTNRMRVLLVDDDPVVRALTARLLKNEFDVQIARDAHEALALLDGGHVSDALLTDFVMPGMDGAELVASLRTRGHALGRCAVVFTGDRALAEVRLAALQIDVPLFDKTVDRQTLSEALRRAATRV